MVCGVMQCRSLTEAPVLPVPYPNRLVITGTDDPRQLMVEEDCPHIIQMPVQRKQTSSRLIAPHLDLVIIPARHEQRLRLMKVDAADRPIMFFKAVNESAHAIIPELDGGRV